MKATDLNAHSDYSSFREKALEYVFVGDCLRGLWSRGVYDAEVLRADVDAAGYDLVMEVNGFTRHIQLKASIKSGKTRHQTIHAKLASKPSGCIVWIIVNSQTLELGPFYWFGGPPGEPLLDISKFGKARHSKGDASGVKKERRHSYQIPRTAFQYNETLDEILDKLFAI